MAILTSGLLKVEIEVAVIVALGLIVDGGIGHTELFADRGHQIRGLVDGGIGQRLFEVIKR